MLSLHHHHHSRRFILLMICALFAFIFWFLTAQAQCVPGDLVCMNLP